MLIPISYFIILIFLLLASAFFSCTETALISLSRVKAYSLVHQNRIGAKAVLKLKQNPERMLITLLIGNNLVNTAASAIATFAFSEVFGSKAIGIATGVMTFVILVFGEITPKALAVRYNTEISLLVARPINILIYVLYPLVLFFEMLIRLWSKKKYRPKLTEHDILASVRLGFIEKVLKQHEKEYIEAILKYTDKDVHDIMIPKKTVFSLDSKMSITDALPLIVKNKFSRIPVYSGKKERVKGFIHIKSVLKEIINQRLDTKLEKIALQPVIITKNKMISSLFKEFQETRTHFAVVVNRKKKMIGIVTLEDILEEIFGEIRDEKDTAEKIIRKLNKNTMIVQRDEEIRKINDILKCDLPEDKYYTMGELVNALASEKNKLPHKKGAAYRLNDIKIRILSLNDQTNDVGSIKIIKKKGQK